MRAKLKSISRRPLRHLRIRKNIIGTNERPRLCVFRSLKHFEAQLIDDMMSRTVVSASTRDKEFRGKIKIGGNVKAAMTLAEYFAKKALEKGYSRVVFDRAGYLYHGRVKAFAEEARKTGLIF